MEIAGPMVELVKMVLAPIRKCWKYHRGSSGYMEILNEKLEALKCRKEDRELRLRAELLPGKKSKKEVELWFAKVEKINLEIEAIQRKFENLKYFYRACFGSIVFKKMRDVEELYEMGVFPDGLVEDIPHFGDLLPTTTLEGETTTKRKMREIWACLIGDEVRKVGVYGMGGIGKTTTMKHINNCILEHKDKFDNVIWVTVSKSSTLIRLQDAIACKLGLNISRYEDETRRAGLLYDSLIRKKRFVLILDDLWEVYRLEDVGIPEPTPENGCKLVLTTRSLDVCRRMSCKSIRMELLSKEEARNLFLNTVGRDVLCDPNLEAIMNEFVEECGCLPLAIITVAGSLKGIVDYCEWKTSLEELKASVEGDTKMGSTVLEQLKFSYERLSDKKLQDCLLYCALYPEDARIYREDLIECLIDEGIIDGLKSRQAGFEKGHSMLNKLENACLLEGLVDDDKVKYVKMHDLVRDMSLQITSANPKFLVQAGVGLRDIPDAERWEEGLVRVSLIRNNISHVQSAASPRCPRLLTLMLNYNILKNVPDGFFSQMNSLKVLDLSYTSIENLPKSVSDLENLTALLVRRCERLKYVSSLANLRALRRLDCSYTGITEVPEGMDFLVNLRYLNLESRTLQMLPDGVLPKLSNLQCLLLCHNFFNILKVKGEELASLRKLETFKGMLYDINHFNTYISSLEERRLANYVIQVGYQVYAYDDLYQYKRHKKAIILTQCDINESLPGEYPLLLPKDVELLSIRECCIVKSLCTLASFNNATNLRSCTISICERIEYVLSSASCIVPLLQNLEELRLEHLSNLHWLIKEENGPASLLPPGTFSSLRNILVQYCSNLKRLFTPSLLSSLQNLEEIHVKYCKQMVEIISTSHNQNKEEGTDLFNIALPNLKVLELWGLPQLKNICNGTESLVASSLHEVSIWKCPNLRSIPFLDKEPYPPLVHSIDVHKQWWESLEWQHPNSKEALQHVCKFWVQE
ncbi:NB-ARC domain, LRR domain containing protein [Trema orientale]|uniref:NB-ARC domain, LRR domain containing protein n=1 Tax=Trema orientale TaxID=63057 RepID=A0A2P5E6H1_TREOI|nr:NB-ARC domain, LRR domain containing protein [Trema orientale]